MRKKLLSPFFPFTSSTRSRIFTHRLRNTPICTANPPTKPITSYLCALCGSNFIWFLPTFIHSPAACVPSYTSPATRPSSCIPGAGAHALSVGWGGVWSGLISALPPPSLSALYTATAARQGAGWQPAVWIRAVLEPQINADERRYCS